MIAYLFTALMLTVCKMDAGMQLLLSECLLCISDKIGRVLQSSE